MGRPPVIPAEQKTQIVLSVLAGELTVAEAGRREKVSELTQALGEAAVELRIWKKSAEGRLGPSMTLRFCQLVDMPERTWRRWQARARDGERPKGPWPQPARESARDRVLAHAGAHPAWGQRERRKLAERRKAAFAADPTWPNQVWQLDFS